MSTAKQMIRELGGTVREAAKRLGCSRQALYNWAKPGAKVPELYVYRYRAIRATQDGAGATISPEPKVR